MRTVLTFGAAALALAVALPAAAQTAGASADTAATPPTSSSSSTTSETASLAVGQPVKDKTGATIGQITELKPDPSGKKVATIRMGADSFAVDSSSLAVQDGAAKINASQAELKDMIKASAPKADATTTTETTPTKKTK